MMQKLKILNKKEVKKILSMLEKQWGFKDEMDYAFLQSEKSRIYIANREIFGLDLSKVKINSYGLYFAEIKSGIRLSIEGSQIVGPKAAKNVIELSDEEAKEWMSGMDIEKETDARDFVILMHGDDFLGTGKATPEGKILNFVPKTRRI